MDQFMVLMKPELLIQTLGLAGVFGVIFAESGLFFGFFLPGDSLLFTAGVLASQRFLSYPMLCIVTFVAAILGDNVGYWFGHKIGHKIFQKEDSLLFKKHHLVEAQKFYEKNGAKTIILARFIPFVRTFAPIVAGAAKMHYETFMLNNLVGGFIWAVGISSLGYFLGNIPIVKHNYEIVILLIIFGSVVPVVWHFVKDQEKRTRIKHAVKHTIHRAIGKKNL